jgi:hypothetical protein
MAQYLAAAEAEVFKDDINQAAPALSVAEKEYRLNTVDNGVKTVTLLSPRNKGAAHTMERITSSSDIREAGALIQDLTQNFNTSLLEGHKFGSGPAYCSVGVMDYVATKEFKGGIQYDYGSEGKHVYNDDRVLTTIEGDESTPDNPIMYTMSKDRNTGEFVWYKILINQVDPRNATREEMFAYITYTTKDDVDAYLNAIWTFEAIDELGVELGLIREDQTYINYIDLFKMAADDHGNILETTNVTPISGVRDLNQEYYDQLLKMIDEMIEHSDETRTQLELQKQIDIGKPEELAKHHGKSSLIE